jgi:hypothetical protein
MKIIRSLTLLAFVTLACSAHASAQAVDFYFGGSATNQTQVFIAPFTLSYYLPSYLNSILSATLTSAPLPGSPASATLQATVYLSNTTVAGFTPIEVANQTLTLNLSTPTATSGTTSTPNYPTTFQTGPSGSFNEVIVDVSSTNLNNAIVSFSGETEVASSVNLPAVPEPASWVLAFVAGATCFVLYRRRQIGDKQDLL